MPLAHWCLWLQDTTLSTALRTSAYAYPLIEGTHVLGLALSVGTILWFDLRLLGVTMRGDRVSYVFGQIRPWMTAGFTVMIVTGSLLFASRAADAYASTYFRIKIGLLVLGAINIVVFHATVDRQREQWDGVATPPFRARMAGLLSLVLWFSIIAAGRIMAYNL
ncbi:MAG TPA: DUF6644 family protein [Vicinamibacterales bacterium]|jgi:hypothetical protein|nr:DUF6644 family protein [Vicinamibacterales bacterium]